jgi:hypothetical protein
MNWRAHVVVGFLVGTPLATAACGSSPTGGGSTGTENSGSGGVQGNSPGSGSSGSSTIGGGSGNSETSGSSSSGGSSGLSQPSGGAATSGGSSGASTGSSSANAGDGGGNGGGDGGGNVPQVPCVKGQVKNNEVVMLGDSYMDIGNVGPTIMKDANNAMYRHYYLAASALNYGSGAYNIPYQFDTEALMDTTVANPKDIKVVILDGGGNDVLINNSQCLTIPLTSDTGNACHTAVDNSVARGAKLEADFASNGVEHIVYYFYPDLDPTVSGHTNASDWLDYSYPKGAASCCGAANVPASGDLSCRGTSSGIDCIWIDMRPEFKGHNDHTKAAEYWFQADNIHPSQPGADAIAAKVWKAMETYCIAQ